MVVPAGTVARFEGLPDSAAQPCSSQPPMAIGPLEMLRSSTNSSLPPDGPCVRSSDMTIVVETACAAAGSASSAPAASAAARSRGRILGTLVLVREKRVSELLYFGGDV